MPIALWVKLLVIGIIALTTVFGAQELFKFKKYSSEETPKEVLNKTPDIVNETKTWIKTTPLEDFKTFLFGGVGGLVKWIVNGVNMVIGWLIHTLKPDANIPNYFGQIVFGLLMIFLLWKGIGSFHDWGYTGLKWLLVVGGAVFALFLTLIFLGVI